MNVREINSTPTAKVPKKKHIFLWFIVALILCAASWFLLSSRAQSPEQEISEKLIFDQTVTSVEQQLIRDKLASQLLTPNSLTTVAVETATSTQNISHVLKIYVPVTAKYSIIQSKTLEQLRLEKVYFTSSIDEPTRKQLTDLLGQDADDAAAVVTNLAEELPAESVAFIPVEELTNDQKLLSIEGQYYLDSFTSGAIFRSAEFTEGDIDSVQPVVLNEYDGKDDIFKVNMSGVTALTRVMLRKLNTVKDPLYFSEKIGDFLADADITHVSNEVSFKTGCTYNDTLFCADPSFIETLKDSGVDLVELTGNHNNDVGSTYNTESINLYQSLGWSTYGGGLNTAEAAKPFYSDKKGSKVAFLAYNYPDSPSGGAISGKDKAGANSFDFDRIKTDIETAKQTNNFVIVNVQYWECYAYPSGYVEYPQCDKPIGKQEADFKKIVDLGADMVIGSSAHQPQTYEMYNGKPIYYGLGNLYFDQTQWPGTERGIILSHYFAEGRLLQTKLTPTVYDKDLQTRIMTVEEASYLLIRLRDAR